MKVLKEELIFVNAPNLVICYLGVYTKILLHHYNLPIKFVQILQWFYFSQYKQ